MQARPCETFTALAAAVLAEPPRLGATRLVCIDGPAGSGKTTFGTALAAVLQAPLVHMDDVYSGWTLVGASARLAAGVLHPLRAGQPGRYHRRDWATGRFVPEPTVVPAGPALVVEGCGSAPRAWDEFSTLRVWVEAPARLRLARGLARDGEQLRPQWLRWQEEEAAYFAADGTRDRADLVVDGAAAVLDEPGGSAPLG